MTAAHHSTRRLVPGGHPTQTDRPARARFAGARVLDSEERLRPRGVGEILDGAFDQFAALFVPCVLVGALLWLPVQIGNELLTISSVDQWTVLLWGMLDVPVRMLVTGYVCAMVGRRLVGGEVHPGEALRAAMWRTPGIVLISIVTGVAAFALICPCVVTTFLAYWLFSVAPAVYVLERTGVFQALARAVRLVWSWGAFGRWLGWFSVAAVLTLPLNGITEGLKQPWVREGLRGYLPLQLETFVWVVLVLGALFLAVGSGYVAVAMTVYYVDQRVRREGFDLERQLELLAKGRGAGAMP
jgi:hypothetical protein